MPKWYKDTAVVGSHLSVLDGPGEALLVGTPTRTYVHLTEKQEAQAKYQKLYPKEVFPRMQLMPYDSPHPVPVKHVTDQKRFMGNGVRIITHVLQNEDDTVRMCFGGTEDARPIIIAGAWRNYNGLRHYTSLDPGSVFAGLEAGRSGDIYVAGANTYSEHVSRDDATDVPYSSNTEYAKALEEKQKAYVEKLVQLREKIAARLRKGSLKHGHIGAFKVKKGVFYYDDVTTLEIVGETYKEVLFNRLAAFASDDFYEILRHITDKGFLIRTVLGGDYQQIDQSLRDNDVDYSVQGEPLRLKIRGTELAVEVRRNKKGLFQSYINGKLVTDGDYEAVVERITCYPESTEDYQAYVNIVSGISLKYHRLNDSGMPFALARTSNANAIEALQAAYQWVDTPAEDRRTDMPQVDQIKHVYPLPAYARTNGRYGHDFRLTIPFRKNSAGVKPAIYILGKWRTLRKGTAGLDSLLGYMDDTGNIYRFQSKHGNTLVHEAWALRSRLVTNHRYHYSGVLNVDSETFTELDKKTQEVFHSFMQRCSENVGNVVANLVQRLATIDGLLVDEDRIFVNGGVTAGVDLACPRGILDDINTGRQRRMDNTDPEEFRAVAETMIPWFDRVCQHIVAPLLVACTDQIQQTDDAVTRSEEILTQAIEDTGSSHIIRDSGDHYVKVTGKSGQIYWISIENGSVSRNTHAKGVDAPGSHLCIVRASSRAEFAGHDYVASLVFALHSDLQTAGNIYTVNNMLKAEGVVA